MSSSVPAAACRYRARRATPIIGGVAPAKGLALPRPDLFIVGAPKSGTTSLYDYLSGHPDVYMSPVKEPLYFCPDVRSGGHRRRFEYPRDEAAYLALYSEAHEEKRLGEATTRYLVSREAPVLIHEFDPDARIIAILRNPVDMIHALHNERLSQGHETIDDFGLALAADVDRAAGRNLPPGTNALGGVYRESARYAEHLARWLAAFPRNQVHVIVFDDFASDTPREFRGVLEFLGVDPDYQPASFAPRNTSHRQRRAVRRIVDSRPGHWLTHRVLGAAIGPNARARLALRFRQSRLNRRVAARAPLPAPLRHELEQEFRPDVERLGEMLDRDLVSLWFGPTESH